MNLKKDFEVEFLGKPITDDNFGAPQWGSIRVYRYAQRGEQTKISIQIWIGRCGFGGKKGEGKRLGNILAQSSLSPGQFKKLFQESGLGGSDGKTELVDN